MPLSSPTSATPADPASFRPPPPATTKPRGNPNLALAPRCGARTRAGCPCRSPAIHGKLRCRMHGGRSPGPRTPEGRDKVRAARTIHGHYGAEARAENRFRTTLRCISRVDAAALLCQAYLPPALAARHRNQNPPELMPPPRPNGGITAAQDRAMRHAVAATLAPWRAAVAEARVAHRAARIAARSTQRAAPAPAADGQTRATDANASSSPPAPPPVPIISCTGDSLPDRELAAHAAGLRAPANRPPAPTAPFKPFRTDPLKREPAPNPVPTAPFKPFRIDPLDREPTPKPGSTAALLGPPEPHAPVCAGAAQATPSPGLPEPHAPVDPRRRTPPHPAIASLLAKLAANLQAMQRAADAAPPAARSPGRSEPRRSEPHAPVAARTPRAEPHTPIPAQQAPLNRAERRRLKYLQRRRDRGAHPRP